MKMIMNNMGYLMIAALFILIFYAACRIDGVKVAVTIFGCAAFLVLWCYVAVLLIGHIT